MLATLAAVHLLVLAQTSGAQAPLPANPPLPRKAAPGEQPPEDTVPDDQVTTAVDVGEFQRA